eukprot:scaffold3224_cov158-Amphora_coffeaeformis.AAC.8
MVYQRHAVGKVSIAHSQYARVWLQARPIDDTKHIRRVFLFFVAVRLHSMAGQSWTRLGALIGPKFGELLIQCHVKTSDFIGAYHTARLRACKCRRMDIKLGDIAKGCRCGSGAW